MAKVTKTPALLVILSLVAVVTIMIGNTTTQVIQQVAFAQQGGQSGFSLTVLVPNHRPGESNVKISLKVDNGYSTYGFADTVVSGTPGLTFSIPPNEGNIYYICVADELAGRLLDTLGNCQYNIPATGEDMTLNIDAG